MVALVTERAFYAAHEAEFSKAHLGRFVVIKGEHVLGRFDTMEQALSAGAAKYGLDSFLVRQVGQKQEEIRIPALTLGLLGANPHHSAHRPGPER